MFCLYCNKSLVNKKNKFCNHSCSASYTNRHRAKHTICLQCKVNITSKQSRAYCSRECFFTARNLKTIDKVLSGELTNRQTLRRHLIVLYGLKCQLCALTEWKDKPVPVILDHIDGNALNNKLDNLRLICPNCDALLPTYMGRNKGKGRAYRRRLYAEGKHQR